ncbi:hypothetical protein AB6A40_007883 [Gnathostoma spinigerum]|uniref:3-phosphoinositide-dependent protein kinase 1 n=1 Tax=Gnathostoma spinigerum TaxID=75299 RepID=A0ABD6ESN7_9BILA
MASIHNSLCESNPTTSSPAELSPDKAKEQESSNKISEAGERKKRASISSWVTATNSAKETQKSADDFIFFRILGEGSFSTVYLAREVSSQKEYAIKVLSKDLIRRNRKMEAVIREKDIMTAITYKNGGHPLFVALYSAFQDVTRLYFVMTYAKNGDLHSYLQRLGSFDDKVSLFYSAEIVCGLEFLHRCHIIHRDLKPENILLSHSRHIMISDFGSAKFLGPDNYSSEPSENSLKCLDAARDANERHCRRSTFVGTAQYISPELLFGGNVGPTCDFWALGAIIFQMISGMAPFRSVNDYHTFQKIQKLDYSFPAGFPELPKDLVKKLLVLNPSERLGSKERGGVKAVHSHPYFATVDWENLTMQSPPEFRPYIPASSGEPAFHSDYVIPSDIEPGLDDAAMTRLLGLNIKEFGSVSGKLTELDSLRPTEEQRQKKLEIQRREHKYHRFVDDHLILKSGLLDKKKGLFARRRMFLLTEGPHIYYVDAINMELKGEIPFSRKLRAEAKNFRTFFLHTPNRTYYLFDPERKAMEWCDAIESLRERYSDELPDEVETLYSKSNKSKGRVGL